VLVFQKGVLADVIGVAQTGLTLLGRRAWWLPRRLDRLVLNLDLKGSALERGPRPVAEAPAPVGGS
jgi:putative drug exporter of the RND superfamily